MARLNKSVHCGLIRVFSPPTAVTARPADRDRGARPRPERPPLRVYPPPPPVICGWPQRAQTTSRASVCRPGCSWPPVSCARREHAMPREPRSDRRPAGACRRNQEPCRGGWPQGSQVVKAQAGVKWSKHKKASSGQSTSRRQVVKEQAGVKWSKHKQASSGQSTSRRQVVKAQAGVKWSKQAGVKWSKRKQASSGHSKQGQVVRAQAGVKWSKHKLASTINCGPLRRVESRSAVSGRRSCY